MPEPVMTIGLGSGVLPLTIEQVKSIVALSKTPEWAVVEHLLTAISQSSQVALRDPEATLDQLRLEQGKVAACGTLADIVAKDVPAWYEKDKA